jgi:hypothetical protein
MSAHLRHAQSGRGGSSNLIHEKEISHALHPISQHRR